MADTFVKIASSTVGAGGTTTITFSSIPSTYTDLCLKFSLRTSRGTYASDLLRVDFNGSTANQSSLFLEGTSITAYFTLSTTQIASATTSITTANTFSNGELYIPNYAGSTYKTISSDSFGENNSTNNAIYLASGLWSNTAAINSISLTDINSATIQQYSSATLYGILKA
jgi:hypothetical protein